MNPIKATKSICPECLKALDATIFEDEGKVFIKKECPEHGPFQELYWSDYDQYVRAEKFRYDGEGIENPRTQKVNGCPLDWGSCPAPTSPPAPNPVPPRALQFSGGQPPIRNDLFDLVRKAKEIGFRHVEVNTNGVRISQSVEYAKDLKAAGVSTIYLQFD